MAIFKNQRGSWTCKLYYTDWTGIRRQKKKEGFKTRKEAKEFEIGFINSCKSDTGILFCNLVDNYLEDCRTRLKPTTCRTKEGIIREKIIPYFKDLPISSIDSIMIRRWQNELIEQDFSGTYLKTINTQLSAIFNYAVNYYNLPSNPVRKCGSIGKSKAGAMQFWTSSEFSRFIEMVDKPSCRTIFKLLFFSGIRIGELLALTPTDFDFDGSSVVISKSYAVVKGESLIQSPKTEKSRRVVTLPTTITGEIISMCKGDEQRLFTISRQTIDKEMERACNRSGVKKIRIHDIRHSHASLLIELGFSPLVICERLGHESIETTLNTYSHLYPNRHEEVAKRLEGLC